MPLIPGYRYLAQWGRSPGRMLYNHLSLGIHELVANFWKEVVVTVVEPGQMAENALTKLYTKAGVTTTDALLPKIVHSAIDDTVGSIATVMAAHYT